MKGYWWLCGHCHQEFYFEEITKSKGIAHFIRDELAANGWNQQALIRTCPQCSEEQARIAYEFPRRNRELIRVHHIVGLGDEESEYLQMMWETSPYPFNVRWFDFKYLVNRNIRGLWSPAVFERSNIAEIFELYRQVTGNHDFP